MVWIPHWVLYAFWAWYNQIPALFKQQRLSIIRNVDKFLIHSYVLFSPSLNIIIFVLQYYHLAPFGSYISFTSEYFTDYFTWLWFRIREIIFCGKASYECLNSANHRYFYTECRKSSMFCPYRLSCNAWGDD